MLSFLVGAVIGAATMAYWRPDLRKLRDEQMPKLRNQAADKLEVFERATVDRIGKVSTRMRSSLRRQSTPQSEDVPSTPRRDEPRAIP